MDPSWRQPVIDPGRNGGGISRGSVKVRLEWKAEQTVVVKGKNVRELARRNDDVEASQCALN